MRILQVKPSAIKFEHNGQKYLLKEKEECILVLYKFNCDDKGRYDLEHLKTVYGDISSFIHIAAPKVGSAYKNADTEKFSEELCRWGFGEAVFKSKAIEITREMRLKELYKNRDALMDELTDVWTEIRILEELK